MRVNILKRLSTDGKRHNLFLNWSQPVPHPVTGKMTRRKFLKIEIIVDPRSAQDRDANRRMNAIAEIKRAEALSGLAAGDYSFLGSNEAGISLQAYMGERKDSHKEGTQKCWHTAIKHLQGYDKGTISLALVDRSFLEGYKAHLLKTCKTRNSAVINFSLVRTALNSAYREELIKTKVTDFVRTIPPEPGKREHLSKSELQQLEETECESEMIKRAAMFAAYTGLRISDVEKVTLSAIKDGTLEHKQTKTGRHEHLPVSKKAMTYLDSEKKPGELQFPGLINKVYQGGCIFQRWVQASGIQKKITFHVFRHTYATRLLEEGVDLYTVSKLLGHKDIHVTQVYGKIVSQVKREAVELL